jgi:Family of unknown function (DUF6114)
MAAHARKPRGPAELAEAARRAWRGWRRSRPFWGAVMIAASGLVTASVRFSLPVHAAWTILPAGLWIAAGLITCGLLLLFDPVQRSAYSVLAILLAIAALKTSHLGGYLIGTLLGLAGGAVAFAWVPMVPAERAPLPAGFRLIRGDADGPAAARPGGPVRHRPAQPGRLPTRVPGRRPEWPRPEDQREDRRSPAWPPDWQHGTEPGWQHGTEPGWQRGAERPRQRDRD